MAGLNSDFLPRDKLEALGFAALGDDVLVHSTAVIVDCARVTLGSRVRIDPFVIISARGGVIFGDNIHVGGHTVMVGQASVDVGDFVNISHHVGIFTTNEDLSGRTLSNPTASNLASAARSANITFGRHSAVGAGSVVLPGARFAEGSVLGAMSRIGRPMKAWTKYSGIPARRTGTRVTDALVHERNYIASLVRPG